MALYQKRPVVIEAFQWKPNAPVADTPSWFFDACAAKQCWTDTDGMLSVFTLECTMTAQPGDWIICGVKGEIYPCKPDIFALTYEPVGKTDYYPPLPPKSVINTHIPTGIKIYGYNEKDMRAYVDADRARRSSEVESVLVPIKVLQQIESWSNAYPTSVFPEPDLKKAHAVLQSEGMTLDSISAYCMRHVITKVLAMLKPYYPGEDEQ